jgi:hypothetical protein
MDGRRGFGLLIARAPKTMRLDMRSLRSFALQTAWLFALSDGCAEEEHAPQQLRDAALPAVEASADPRYSFPCLGVPTVTSAPTFSAIYFEVLCNSGCVDAYCHGSRGRWADLDFSQLDIAYYDLVGHESGKLVPVDHRPTCAESSLLRVKPYAPDESLLYLKLSGRAPCGTRMPPPSSEYDPLGDAQREQVRRWIELGAKSFKDET